MAQISRIYALNNWVYLWDLCYLWEVFKKCIVMRIKGENASLEAVRSQTWVENESFPFFIPDFCAASAQKSGNVEEMLAFLPTLDLNRVFNALSTLDSH